MNDPPSTNFLIHFIEFLPEFPSPDTPWPIAKLFLRQKRQKTVTAIFWLKHANRYRDLKASEYRPLRNILRDYLEQLNRMLNPIDGVPDEILVYIFKLAAPEIILNDYPRSHRHTRPTISCPQLRVFARVSRKFHAIVLSNPSLFSTVRLRRQARCLPHHPIAHHRIARIQSLAQSLPLDVTVEFVDKGDFNFVTMPAVVATSPCMSMDHLKTSHWRSFALEGASYLVASILEDVDVLPHLPNPISLSLTSLQVTRLPSLESFLRILTRSTIPLQNLSITVTDDSWERPNLNHSLQLPRTISYIHIKGTSRVALCILRAAPFVANVTVTLIAGLDAVLSGLRKRNPIHFWPLAMTTVIELSGLQTLAVEDDDNRAAAGIDFFTSITAPNLLSWSLQYRYPFPREYQISPDYLSAMNTFLARHPSLLHVIALDAPPEINELQSPFPQDVTAEDD
ncbi:hypothetical protein VNI00_007190 [Paramarasmius palmivorus]|uniref:F-box domain-containing protein n=1 Tax=Paramarasmius palmivorus TaxID=297713 RepID=A0AAW0D566_9AGAR